MTQSRHLSSPFLEYSLMFKKTVPAACLVVSGLLASVVHAAPTTFFGQNLTPNMQVTGDPVTARAGFLSQLTNSVQSQGFESFAAGTAPGVNGLALTFTGTATNIGATLFGPGAIESGAPNANFPGRFNTTPGGSNWYDTNASSFNINFAKPISAFGFYATDVGDFSGQLSLLLTDKAGVVTKVSVGNKPNASNGNLLFFGFVDTGDTYTKIQFQNSASQVDYFGFDDMVVGDSGQLNQCAPNCSGPGNPVPEPGSLALAGLALAGLALSHRKQRG